MNEKNDQRRWGSRGKLIRLRRLLVILLGLMMIIITPVTAVTTSIHIIRYANDRTTVLNETTKTYQWLEANLPVLGDGTTHYYSQGPTFNESDLWDNAEWQNVDTRDWGAVKGSYLKDICNLVGGMSVGETVSIRASDGFSKLLPYEYVYTPNSRQGPMGITWYRADQGYVSSYTDGMRLVMFADAKTNTYRWNTSGWHVFGNADMRDCWAPNYWYNYSSTWPSSGGVSVKSVSDVIIYSNKIQPATITVTAPDGGETWQRGTSKTITWDYTGSPGSYVKIMLVKGTAEVGTISASTSTGSTGKGSYTWPISPTGSTGSDYKVSVQSISQPAVKDLSNTYFTLGQPGTPAPSITVTAPDGGETWQRGTSKTITWDYTGSPGSYVKIMLVKGTTEVGTISVSTSTGSTGKGSYTWPISPTGSTGSDYKVSVQSISQPAVKDLSNTYFTLGQPGTPAPSITVTAPNGGETWQRGTSKTITWDYTGSPGSYVKIMLVKGTTEVGTISASTSMGSGGHGSYAWRIYSSGSIGTDYKVSVQSISQPAVKDLSNTYFTLGQPGTPAPSITVTAPNGGESWKRGTTHTVSWDYTGSPGSYVKIMLVKGTTEVGIISASTSMGSGGHGSYTWPIYSSGSTGSDYKVSVQSISQPAVKDWSNNYFTLTL